MRIISLAAGLIALATAPVAAAAVRVSYPEVSASPPAMEAAALNHVYVVVDAETFAALRDSTALAALLGRADGGLPDYAPPAPDADRVFFRGRRTYLEIFAPENRFGEPVGKIGLALGHDDPSAFEELDAAWRLACPEGFRRSPVAYQRTEPPVPWYDAVQCDETAVGDHLAIWAMVYLPQFHAWQAGGVAGPARTARADILAPRVAQGQGRFDIAGLSLNVTPETFDLLAEQLTRAGLVHEQTPDGASFTGADWTLELRRSDQTRLAAIEFSTSSDLSEPLTLGTGKLLPHAVGQVRWLP